MSQRKLSIYLFFMASLLSACLPGPAAAEVFAILTEEIPPYSYSDGGRVAGTAVNVVRELLRRVGHPDTIEIRTWSLAYHLARTEDNHVIFSTARTPKREDMFKWVGPILEDNLVFFARKASGLAINSLDDARKVKKIGVYRHDVSEDHLAEMGFSNLESASQSAQNARKLAAGRLELWAENEVVGVETARRENLSDKIEKVFVVAHQVMYIAFNRNTPDSIILTWQKALDQMKADGAYNRILNPFALKD